MAKKQFSACAKLMVWLLSVGAFLGTLFALIGGEGASISRCARDYQDNGLSLTTLPDACSRNKRGSPWLEGTCGERDVSLTLYEYCDRPTVASGTAWSYTCYDFVDRPASFFKTKAALATAEKDFVKEFEEAQKLVVSAVVFSVLLLAFGCLVLVDNDVDNGAKTTFSGMLICLAHIACSGSALGLVHGSSMHAGAGACTTTMRGSGVLALAIAVGCSSLTLMLFFPCFCGPCAVCLEGGSDEEKERSEGKTGIWATLCSCTMAVAVCFATAVGIVYSSVRTVVTKSWVIIWPLLCLPCCCLTKIIGKRLHPSEKVLKLCTLLSIAVFGLLSSVLFGQQKTFAGATTAHGGFSSPLAKATCTDKRVLFVTLSEGCLVKNSGGIDCHDYADGALPSVFGSTATTKFHKTLGQEAFALLLVAALVQLVCVFALVSIFSCGACRRQPQAASVLTGVGLMLATALAVTATLLINDAALLSSWAPSPSCVAAAAGAQEKMGPGMLMIVLAIVINGIVAVLVHWPIYVSMFSCLKCCQSSVCKACVDEDEEDEDIPEGEFPNTSSELKAARQGTKHVV